MEKQDEVIEKVKHASALKKLEGQLLCRLKNSLSHQEKELNRTEMFLPKSKFIGRSPKKDNRLAKLAIDAKTPPSAEIKQSHGASKEILMDIK
jgi:hypothetical protein